MKKKTFTFTSLLLVFGFLLVLSLGLFFERGGVRYNSKQNNSYYLKKSQVKTSQEVADSLPKTNLVIYDSSNITSAQAIDNFKQIFKDMKVGSDYIDIATTAIPDYTAYRTVVVLTPSLESMGEKALSLMDWVQAGGNAMFGMTLGSDSVSSIISRQMGIMITSSDYAMVKTISPSKDFMLGGGQSFKIDEAFESAWQVSLDDNAKVYMTTDDENKVPLVWSYDYGQGRVAVDNFGIYDKAYRGFYAATYSLLDDVGVYPVINASSFTLDDFPSPVPNGDGTYIQRDYNMKTADFYSMVWWPDMMKLANKYGIKYTGVVIENYENQTNGTVPAQEDQSRFSYFGKTLLKSGGEIGYHGYNHQPLVLPDTDYGDEFDYKAWANEKAIKNSLNELIRFTGELFPDAQKSVYVPPSNILSEQARQILKKDYPEIKVIASNYFSGHYVYSQEFEVAEDGMIEAPRISSGTLIDDYMKITMLSELNMHYLSHHFVHPDDPLDVDRGAKLGWKKMYSNLSAQFKWLYTTAPSIRNLTESQMGGAIERFSNVIVSKSVTTDKITLDLGHFVDEVYLMVRVNDGTIGTVTGGSLEKLADNLYLLHAQKKRVVIQRNGSE